jgi:hypothetical protein
VPLITKKCEHCGAEFETKDAPSRAATNRGRFCSRSCAKTHWFDTHGRKLLHYESTRIPGHPLAAKNGDVQMHRLLLYERIGPGSHPCQWCGAPLTWMARMRPNTPGYLTADHLDHDHRNNDPANLVPSCYRCNISRSATRLGPDVLTVKNGSKRTRAVWRSCKLCGVRFLHMAAARQPNKGQFCSRSCAVKYDWAVGRHDNLRGPRRR